MKKMMALIACGILTIGLTACAAETKTTGSNAESAVSGTGITENTASGTAAEKNEIAKLADDGYEETESTFDNGKWIGIFTKDGSYLKVTADFPAAAEEKYEALDMMADDYNEQVQAIVYSLDNVKSEDITDQVPAQEELNAYVGKTMGDLENDGYERTGYFGEEGDYTFTFEGDKYCLDVDVKDGENIKDMDDLSENDIRAMEISSVSFNSFSAGVLYE